MKQAHFPLVRVTLIISFVLIMAAVPMMSLPIKGSVTSASATGITYNIANLGTQAFGINSAGQVTGLANDAFVFTPSTPDGSSGTQIDLGTLGGNVSSGQGVNASGQVAGYSTNSRGTYRTFLYTKGAIRDIGSLPGGSADAYGINDDGQVVGFSYTGQITAYNAWIYHAFLWTPTKPNGKTGKMIDLGTLGGFFSIAHAINSSGQVVGFAYDAAGDPVAFLYSQGNKTSLGTLGGDWSNAFAINDAGQVVGEAYTANNAGSHAFLWQNGNMIDLGVLPTGNYASALALNSTGGEIVGTSTVPGTNGYLAYHAFVYENGSMTDLNSLTPAGSGWVLQSATGVNDAGEIVGYGTYQGQLKGFLLTSQ